MPALPDDFFSRRELQQLAVQAGDLASVSGRDDDEVRIGLALLARGALLLEGYLADVPLRPPVPPKLANKQCWVSCWNENEVLLPTPTGNVRLSVAVQIMRRPAMPRRALATGRYRLRLGTEEHTSCDLTKLRNIAIIYLNRFGADDETKDRVISMLTHEDE